MNDRALLADLHRAAREHVHAGRALARELAARDPGPGPFVLLAAGKAACAMAEAAQRALGARIARGAVTTKDGYGRALAGLALREASHPLPDARSERAGREALALAGSLSGSEELLVLISGGASALWCVPAPGLELADKLEANRQLLRGGVPIAEFNTVRKHLSALKGGGLVRVAAGRRVRVYAVSDVKDDSLGDIGSGPASPDPSSFVNALWVLRAHRLERDFPPAALERLRRGVAGELEETLKREDPLAAACDGRVVAELRMAIGAAQREATARGLRSRSLGRALDADVAALADSLALEVRRAAADGIDLLVAGGEPTVTVRGAGTGGRAQELALRLALALADLPGWTALCAGTDGTDGPTDAAGAFANPTLPARAQALGRDPRAHLALNDVHPLLAATSDLFRTGPTETNVSDLLLVRVRGSGARGRMA